MLPLHAYTLGAGTIAIAAAFLAPESARPPIWAATAAALLALAVRGSLAPRSRLLGPCTTGIDPTRREVALTFDDGPDPTTTPALLALLAEHGATATFFVIGEQVERHPELVCGIHSAGHRIGNHSHRHKIWNAFTTGRLRRDLGRCQTAVQRACGEPPRLFRPPYGVRTHATSAAAAAHGLEVVGWSAGGFDTTRRSVERLAATIAARLEPGAIVLLHDRGPGKDKTLALTRAVLDLCASRGLRVRAM